MAPGAKFLRSLRTLMHSPSAIVVGETACVAFLQFAIYAALIRIAEAEAVGLWVLINSILGFSRAADFWSRGLSSFVAQARGLGEPERASAYAATATAAATAGYLVMALLGYGAIHLFADRLVGPEQVEVVRQILPLMTLTFWMMSVGGTLSLAFLGFERIAVKASLTVGGALVFFLLVLIMVPRFGLWGAVAAQALQAALVLLVGLWLWWQLILRPHGGGLRLTLLREMCVYGAKSLALSLFQLAIEPLSRLIVNAYGGLAAVALYELAARLVVTARSLVLSMGQFLVPAFARLGHEGQNIAGLLRQTEWQFQLLGLVTFSALLAAGPLLATIILSEPNPLFLVMLWLLSAGWFTNLLAAPAYFLFQGRRQLRPLFVSHIIMTLGALGLGVLGGSLFGIVGALTGIALALTTSSAQLWYAAAQARSEQTGSGIRPPLFLPLLTAAACTSLLYIVDRGGWTQTAEIAIQVLPVFATGSMMLATLPLRALLASLSRTKGHATP